jgi:hypothetical protein
MVSESCSSIRRLWAVDSIPGTYVEELAYPP